MTSIERKILKFLEGPGGFLTKQIARAIGQPTGCTRTWLRSMAEEGLVAHLDDRVPVCWVLTQKGTDLLKEQAA